MTDAISKEAALAELERHAKGRTTIGGQTFRTIQLGEATEAIEALPAVTPGVKVKPLVWEDFDGRGAKASAYYQANYLIQFWKSRGQFEVALSFPGYQTGYDGERWHETLEAAKAAAQADYEARILAALDLTPQPAPDVAGVVEAMRGALQVTRDRFASFKFNSLGDFYDPSKDSDFAEADAALAAMEGKP